MYEKIITVLIRLIFLIALELGIAPKRISELISIAAPGNTYLNAREGLLEELDYTCKKSDRGMS